MYGMVAGWERARAPLPLAERRRLTTAAEEVADRRSSKGATQREEPRSEEVHGGVADLGSELTDSDGFACS